LGVLRIVIKNNIIIDLRTKILFGRCFPHYLEYCFHVLFYYYYFSIKHQNNPPPQNPPLATVTHPANPAPISPANHYHHNPPKKPPQATQQAIPTHQGAKPHHPTSPLEQKPTITTAK
jgi:hypothetical protein